MSPRVFVLNNAGHDFRAAQRFTTEEFVIVSEGNVPVFHTDRLYRQVESALETFAAEDYLLISGTPLLAAMAAVVLAKKEKLNGINILLWSPSRRQYTARVLDLRGTTDDYAGAFDPRAQETTSEDGRPAATEGSA